MTIIEFLKLRTKYEAQARDRMEAYQNAGIGDTPYPNRIFEAMVMDLIEKVDALQKFNAELYGDPSAKPAAQK